MNYTNFRKDREKRVKALVDRGYATGNEMLIAQFGEMPKGLDQTRPLDDEMTFHGVTEDKGPGYLGSLIGYGHIQPNEEERRIYINRFMNRLPGRLVGLLTGRMAIARAHDLVEGSLDYFSHAAGEIGLGIGALTTLLTFVSSFRFAMASSITKALSASHANTAAQEFIHTLEHKSEEQSWAISNAFRANAEDLMKNEPQKWANAMRRIDAIITMMPRGHYQADSEIMARMFLLAVRGYDRYGKIAENPRETWAFLGDLGVKTLLSTEVYFQEKHFEPMRELFFKQNLSGLFFPPTAEINIGINAYRRKAVLQMYWADAFPAMMAELHHLLGDENAYEKFGFDLNDRDLKGVPRPFRPEENYADDVRETPGVT